MRREEDRIAGILENHALDHRDSDYMITFAAGDSYLCRWVNGEYTDNDEDCDTPEYDEWYELDYKVLEVLKEGPNKALGYDYIQISRKHVPSLVMCNGEVVFDISNES